MPGECLVPSPQPRHMLIPPSLRTIPTCAVDPIASHSYIVAMNDETSDLKVGDKVGIKWIAHSCNRCVFCRQGYEPLCKQAQCSGYSVDGSL